MAEIFRFMTFSHSSISDLTEIFNLVPSDRTFNTAIETISASKAIIQKYS
jgi:hypothetical protein